MESLKYFDCHSHPHDPKYKKENIDIDQILLELKQDGGGTIAIGTDYENGKEAIELSKKHSNVWATIGIHPADNQAEIFDEKKLEELLELGQGKVVGVGECGLDYYYFSSFAKASKDKGEIFDEEAEKNRQKELFIKQINFAFKHNLPLVLHGRPTKNSMDAYRDMLDILELAASGRKLSGGVEIADEDVRHGLAATSASEAAISSPEELKVKNKLRGHAHFFVGNQEIADRFLKLGFLLSFDGPITFATEYDNVIKNTPIEMLMIETDSPYAAPTPYRGQICKPQYVKFVGKKIAELKNMTAEEVLEITKNNAIKLFKLE